MSNIAVVHAPGPWDDGLRYCQGCRQVWPCPTVSPLTPLRPSCSVLDADGNRCVFGEQHTLNYHLSMKGRFAEPGSQAHSIPYLPLASSAWKRTGEPPTSGANASACES
jgi:hypothetical protein